MCLSLRLSISCLCDAFFITTFIFLTINHTISLKQTYLIWTFLSKVQPRGVTDKNVAYKQNLHNIDRFLALSGYLLLHELL